MPRYKGNRRIIIIQKANANFLFLQKAIRMRFLDMPSEKRELISFSSRAYRIGLFEELRKYPNALIISSAVLEETDWPTVNKMFQEIKAEFPEVILLLFSTLVFQDAEIIHISDGAIWKSGDSGVGYENVAKLVASIDAACTAEILRARFLFIVGPRHHMH